MVSDFKALSASNDAHIDKNEPTTTKAIAIIPAFMQAANDESYAVVQKLNPIKTSDQKQKSENTDQNPNNEHDTNPSPENRGLFSGMFANFAEKREIKSDQKNRIAFAAYMNADSSSEADIQKWVKQAFKNGSVGDFKGDHDIKITEKDVLKHLDGGLLRGLGKKQHNALKEARANHIKEEANQFFDKNSPTEEKTAPKSLGRLSYISSNWKEQPIKSMFGLTANLGIASVNAIPASIDTIRTRNFEKNEIKQEQKDRLLTVAFRDAKDITKSGIRAWLEKSEKNGTLELIKGDHKDLTVSVDDVMKNFRSLSRDQKNTLIEARNDYAKRDIAKETNTAYDSFNMG